MRLAGLRVLRSPPVGESHSALDASNYTISLCFCKDFCKGGVIPAARVVMEVQFSRDEKMISPGVQQAGRMFSRAREVGWA